MTASQYKNIVQWTLCECNFPTEEQPLKVARKLFKNLGISFPQEGTCDQLLHILKANTFLGWRQNSWEDAQKYADLGIVSIGINKSKIILIMPDKSTPILTNIPDVISAENPNVKHTGNLSDAEKKNMYFFSYRYRFELDNNT